MRILFYLTVMAACGGAAAQTGAVQPPVRDYAIPHDSRVQVPAVSPVQTVVVKTAPSLVVRPQQTIVLSPHQAGLAANRSVCYAIRSYNYEATPSLTEMPKAKDETTCVAAADAKLKGARGPVILR